MQKLDAKFSGTITKAKDGSIVPDDEYVVFLAKDTVFALVLPMYREICATLGADPEQMDAVDALIVRVSAWRMANSDKCKVPDAAGERMLPV